MPGKNGNLEPDKPTATEGEYRGRPSLQLEWRPGHPYPFSIGVGRAKLILKLIPQIEAFVARNDRQRSTHAEGGRR